MFTITNSCSYPVWPGILSNAGTPPPPTTGFALSPGQSLPCCSGPDHGTPNTCAPTAYSKFFKAECPEAYSYAYDDASSTFTCAGNGNGGGYDVVFCPGESSGGKASPPASAAAAYPPMAFSSGGANPATTTSHAVIAVLLLLFIINLGL